MDIKIKSQASRSTTQEKFDLLIRTAEAIQIGLTKKSYKTLEELTLLRSQNTQTIKGDIMTPVEAEETIGLYWKSYKDLSATTEIFQPISDLPFSIGRIKYAHYVYAEGLIINLLFTKKIGDQLIESYSDVNLRFLEDPEVHNAKWKQYRDNLNSGIISDNPLSVLCEKALEESIEFNNFLAEMLKVIKELISQRQHAK